LNVLLILPMSTIYLASFILLYLITFGEEYVGVSKSFRTESITKWITTINTRLEATRRVMAAKLTRLTYRIAIQLHLVAESCTICSSHSRWPVQKLLDTPSYKLCLSPCVVKKNWEEHILKSVYCK
jgi:hypothetical protein